jgi:hypothetical protein
VKAFKIGDEAKKAVFICKQDERWEVGGVENDGGGDLTDWRARGKSQVSVSQEREKGVTPPIQLTAVSLASRWRLWQFVAFLPIEPREDRSKFRGCGAIEPNLSVIGDEAGRAVFIAGRRATGSGGVEDEGGGDRTV